MKVDGTLVNGSTPCFVIPGPPQAPYGTVFGAVSQGSEWFAPAYYPFGEWVLSDLRTLVPGLTLTGDALKFSQWLSDSAYAVRQAEAALAAEAKVKLDVPEDFFPPDFTPYVHQYYGVDRIQHWWRTWFIWDMGTGKTRTSLDGFRLLERGGSFKKALILGPPVVLNGWLRETRKVSGGRWKAVLLDGTPESFEAAKDAKIVAVSYARARMEANFTVDHPQLGKTPFFAPERSRLLTLDYDVIVADESHNLGNVKSEQTQAALELSKLAARRYCLTGTPGADPGKIYAQLHFLSPALLNMTWEKFQNKHFVFSERNQQMVTGYRGLNELNAVVDSIATRIKKAECLDLPPLTVVDIPFALGTRQKERYNEIVEELRVSMAPILNPPEGSVRHLPVVQEKLVFALPNRAIANNKLLQVLSGFVIEGVDESVCNTCEHMDDCVEARIRPYTKGCKVAQRAPKMNLIQDMENPKLDTFRELMTEILTADPTNKVLCWGIFKHELDMMEAVVKKLGVGQVRLDGKTTKHSGDIEDAVNHDPNIRVLVGMVSAGIGINLQQANFMIFYSLPWQTLRYWQAMDRYNRPGQRREMTCYRLLTAEGSGAVDRSVAGVLKFKDRVEATMVGRVACLQCARVEACALDGTSPFRENCTYSAAVARPITKVGVV